MSSWNHAGAGVLTVVVAVGVLFGLYPHVARRLFSNTLDARGAAAFRITFSIAVLLTLLAFLPDLDLFFSDEGIWPAALSRSVFGKQFDRLWDPQLGFEQPWHVITMLFGRFSVLYVRNEPAVVYALFAFTAISTLLMLVGWHTRFFTFATWLGFSHFYATSNIFVTGWDSTLRAFLFLAIFVAWGDAYSLDARRKRHRALRTGHTLPARTNIAAWPIYLVMLQLTVIYCYTGVAKSGPTWWNGTALYYALNLYHYQRAPLTGVWSLLHWIGVLPLATMAVHFWEMFFPVAFVTAMVRAVRQAGPPPYIAAWRHRAAWAVGAVIWLTVAFVAGFVAADVHDPKYAPFEISKDTVNVLVVAVVIISTPSLIAAARAALRRWPALRSAGNKGPWLLFGVAMHVGIDISMNVGLFSLVIMCTYPAWLTGPDLDRLEAWLGSLPAAVGQAGRPARHGWRQILWGPLDRLRFRVLPSPVTVLYAPGEDAVRRAARLRAWDPRALITFREDESLTSDRLALVNNDHVIAGSFAGAELVTRLPALAPLRLVLSLRGGHHVAGRAALWLTGQR